MYKKLLREFLNGKHDFDKFCEENNLQPKQAKKLWDKVLKEA